jgi:hypothetical protein
LMNLILRFWLRIILILFRTFFVRVVDTFHITLLFPFHGGIGRSTDCRHRRRTVIPMCRLLHHYRH